jgi:hypothetical protein
MTTTRGLHSVLLLTRSQLRSAGVAAAIGLGCAAASDESGDPEDGSFSGAKADGFCAEEGSPEAVGILAFVNDPKTSVDLLDRATSNGGVGLDRRAAEGIVEDRPFATLAELDLVPFVGVMSCGALLRHACEVEGRCETTTSCQTDTFETRPARTAYDSHCEELLLAILASRPTENADESVTDPTTRCEDLPTTERRAFDWVATEFDTPPAEFAESFGEFSIVEIGFETDTDVALLHVIEENNFTPFHVMLDGDALAMIWTTDGLSAGVDWFCGGTGMPAEAPDEFCLGALTDDAALCDASAVEHEEIARTVEEARAAGEELVNAAIVEHANAHDLGDDASITADVAACESAVVVTLTTDGVAAETYRVVDSTRGLGITVLTRTDAAGATSIVCAFPE